MPCKLGMGMVMGGSKSCRKCLRCCSTYVRRVNAGIACWGCGLSGAALGANARCKEEREKCRVITRDALTSSSAALNGSMMSLRGIAWVCSGHKQER
jgi:hypothetical protein